ncbi:UNVERIFIED_ORG: hypothetical protein ABIC97_004968 [Peribacillus simplex]
MESLVYFINLIIFSLFIDKFLRKWLGVEKGKISENSGNNIDRWVILKKVEPLSKI